ncbi:hypothetical protein BC834DRAFT_140225 [Gloeopeniophorella convolvens]|nr:hypothetical protein BC834DRAFT_140225 [Gloeopeniophorella convolvens]
MNDPYLGIVTLDRVKSVSNHQLKIVIDALTLARNSSRLRLHRRRLVCNIFESGQAFADAGMRTSRQNQGETIGSPYLVQDRSHQDRLGSRTSNRLTRRITNPVPKRETTVAEHDGRLDESCWRESSAQETCETDSIMLQDAVRHNRLVTGIRVRVKTACGKERQTPLAACVKWHAPTANAYKPCG